MLNLRRGSDVSYEGLGPDTATVMAGQENWKQEKYFNYRSSYNYPPFTWRWRDGAFLLHFLHFQKLYLWARSHNVKDKLTLQ